MCEQDLALNNPQMLIRHTPNQSKWLIYSELAKGKRP